MCTHRYIYWPRHHKTTSLYYCANFFSHKRHTHSTKRYIHTKRPILYVCVQYSTTTILQRRGGRYIMCPYGCCTTISTQFPIKIAWQNNSGARAFSSQQAPLKKLKSTVANCRSGKSYKAINEEKNLVLPPTMKS